VLFDRALGLLVEGHASTLVRSAAMSWFQAQRNRLPATLSRQLAAFERNPKEFKLPQPPSAPPGQPIGEDDCGFPR